MELLLVSLFDALNSDRAAQRRVEVGSDLPDLPKRTETSSQHVFVIMMILDLFC